MHWPSKAQVLKYLRDMVHTCKLHWLRVLQEPKAGTLTKREKFGVTLCYYNMYHCTFIYLAGLLADATPDGMTMVR